MADKKLDILEFFEQSNFEQFTPTPKYNIKGNDHEIEVVFFRRSKVMFFRFKKTFDLVF